MFQAQASSGEANDTVQVQFFVDGVLQGTDSTSPYSVNLSSLAAGTYTLMARAIDGQSAQTDSVTRTITVSDTNNPPTVSITAPANDANFPTAPASFTLSATAGAGEISGWVTRVEFYVNGSLVNTDSAGPFSFNVSGLANGTYVLTAKAVDQLNAETISAPITVTVGAAPLKAYFIHTDHLGTPRLIADSTGTTVWRNDNTEPFGANPPDENPSGLGAFEFPLRFPGQYFDKESNLAYNYFRDYDAALGRYTRSDPIGLRGGLNTYGYVRSNPLRFRDPYGLQMFPRWWRLRPPPGGGSGSGTGSPSSGPTGDRELDNAIRDAEGRRIPPSAADDRENANDGAKEGDKEREAKESKRRGCEAICDANLTRDLQECEIYGAMTGEAYTYVACKQEARRIHLDCVFQCGQDCK